MAAGQHNPSRRALLGAAVGLSFETGLRRAQPLLRMSAEGEAGAVTGPLNHAAHGPPPRAGEDWRRALAAFEAAEAELRTVERRTAGAPWEEQEAIEEEYGDRLDALYTALRLLLRVPAPDLAAFAVKIELMIDQEVATLSGGEACLAAIRRDVRRLAAVGESRATQKEGRHELNS